MMTDDDDAAVVVVRRMLDAFLAGDIETVLGCIADDIEWRHAEHHPFLHGPVYRKREQLIEEVFGKVAEELEDFRFEIQRVVGCGNSAFTQLRYHGVVRATGHALDTQAGMVWDVAHGNIVSVQEYMDTWAMINAWGPERYVRPGSLIAHGHS
jgi:ketosteroid isomerase-like protein